MKASDWIDPKFCAEPWALTHRRAMRFQTTALATAIDAWCYYASHHQAQFGSKIGDDQVLGPAWAKWGEALLTLLNGDLNGMDGGTLDKIIRDNLTEQGYDPDGERNV